jgi:hypothetical protein
MKRRLWNLISFWWINLLESVYMKDLYWKIYTQEFSVMKRVQPINIT